MPNVGTAARQNTSWISLHGRRWRAPTNAVAVELGIHIVAKLPVRCEKSATVAIYAWLWRVWVPE